MEVKILFIILSLLISFSISLFISHMIYNSIVFSKIKKRYGENALKFLNDLVKSKLKFNNREIEKYGLASTIWGIIWGILFILLYVMIFFFLIREQFIPIAYLTPVIIVLFIPIITIFFALKVNLENIKEVKTDLDFFIFTLPIFINFDFSFFYFKAGGKLLPLGYIPPFIWVDNNKIYSKYLFLLDRLEKVLYVIPNILLLLLLPYVLIFSVVISSIEKNYYSLIIVPIAICLLALQMVQIRESVLKKFISKNPKISKGLAYLVIISFLISIGCLTVAFFIFFIWLIYQSIFLSLNPTDPHYSDRWFIYIMLITLPLPFFWDKIKIKLHK